MLFWTGAAAATMLFAYLAIPVLAKPIAKRIPLSWDQALGDFVVDHVVGNVPQCTNPKGVEALTLIHQRIAEANPELPNITLKVVDKDITNAFATPGNNIVFFRGLIEEAESAEEVAGVLAHEMGHVLKRHATEGVIRDMGMIFVSEMMLGGTGEFAAVLLTLDFSRAAEEEADRLALMFMDKANIDPRGLSEFFTRLYSLFEDEKEKKSPEEKAVLDSLDYLSTHPHPLSRATSIKDSRKDRTYRPVLTKAQWSDLQDICDNDKDD